MPKVPSYDNFQSQVSAQPAPLLSAPTGPAAGAIAADQASNMGAALSRTGGAVARLALDADEQANQVRVNDAMNQLHAAAQSLAYDTQNGYTQRRGKAALDPDVDGRPLDQVYGDRLKTRASELAMSLGNEAQKRAFNMHAGTLVTQFHGEVGRHMTKEFGVYNDKVDDGTVDLGTNDAMVHWDDPDYINGRLDPATGSRGPGVIAAIKAAVMNKAQRAGLTGTPAEEAMLAAVSKAQSGVVLTALAKGNPQYALQYLDGARKRGELSADDVLKLQGHVDLAVSNNLAQAAVTVATTRVLPAIAPSSFDTMVQITAMSESGGRETNRDGSTVTSPKGAQGVMQVMPTTNKDPGFGVTPARDDSPGERARVGRDYLQSMLQKYGDPAKAWAAYNAGPGALDKALSQAAAGRSGSPDWLSYMPKETQAYVAKNMSALEKGRPVAPRPTELEFVDSVLAQLPPGAPAQTVRITREAAVAKFNMINRSITEQGENALAAAQRWVIDNKDTPVSMLPPKLLDDLRRFAPGKVDDLDKFSKQLKTGDTTTNTAVYLKLASDPQYLGGLTDAQFFLLRPMLAEKDFVEFNKTRMAQRTGTGAGGWGNLNTQAINDTMSSRLRSLKIDPTPKEGSDDAVYVGSLHKFVRDEIATAQRAAGKAFSDVETAKFIDGLFASNVQFKNTVMGVAVGSSSKSLLALKPDDIPGDVKQALKKDFAARGNSNPSDADYLGAYLYLKRHAPQPRSNTGAK
ncbi:transglycosylase SLT domain-containing protein [Variovorax terrae]|uniref:Transglycosylase SLT domain-containing protein n=1 Tax=Variovorax terrae TaxID=2923278 RepID=A0A9X1VUQ6_9BURK|nr:transglycosylase SLT domain-containing protein [Variovorax terrae]MCJ0764161.1 transglycosylase SLT domain-containing protein [Variovorax terrae]